MTVLFFFLSGNVSSATLEMTPYGEINISRNWIDSNGSSDSYWISNVSKLGFKGSYAIDDSLSVIYQLEQEVDYVHGGTDADTLFGMRNSFIGLEGDFGKVFWGIHDTPLKKAQGKVDVFNDQAGDIKTLLVGEIRSTDSFMYNSPVFAENYSVQTMYAPADSNFDAGYSAALSYQNGDLSAALAMDSGMRKNNKSVLSTKVYDSARLAVQYAIGSWKLGAIIQQSERQNAVGADKETGYVMSAIYKFNDWAFLMQTGRSDIIAEGGKADSLGVDYFFNKKTKTYLYWSNLGDDLGDYDIVSLGFEFKF